MSERFSFDDNGWVMGEVSPLPVDACYSLLAPNTSTVLHAEALRHRAERFFRLELELLTSKRYPGGGHPRSDAAVFRVHRGEEARDLEVVTFPLEHGELARAAHVAGAHVGAGFDVLIARAVRAWQVALPPHGEAFALALATVLASSLLAPILPPDASVVFGVKTARARLEALGWRT